MPSFIAGESLAGVDEAYRYYFRILFRADTIGGIFLSGLAFFIDARKIKAGKLRDYLTIAGIGDTIVGIALSTFALQKNIRSSRLTHLCYYHFIYFARECIFRQLRYSKITP